MRLTIETLAARIREHVRASEFKDQDIADAIGLDPTAFSKALSGRRNFKPLELARLADYIGVPVDVLLSDEHTPPVLVAARTDAETPAVLEARDRVDQILHLNRLLLDVGCSNPESLSFKSIGLGPIDQGQNLAREVRQHLGVNRLPPEFGDLTRMMEEQLRVDVAVETLPGGVDGLSVVQEDFKLILISNAAPATRQRFTLAHELGHIFADAPQNPLVDQNVTFTGTPEEARANAFAAEFLVPSEQLTQELRGNEENEKAVGKLLGKYRVSLDVLAFRAHNAGVVDAQGRDNIRRMRSAGIVARAGRESDLQAMSKSRVPQRLLVRAIRAYAYGEISIRPIAGLLGTDADTLIDELNIAASEHDLTNEMVP